MTGTAETGLPVDLTEDEVLRIVDMIERFDPIVVGGQAVNLWVQYFRTARSGFLGSATYSSRDIDFYRNMDAARALADQLQGTILVPGPGDATPNAAVVLGTLGERKITIDFMTAILGVDDRRIENNQVLIELFLAGSGRSIRILLLHPLDCLRSRLANVNTLKRQDEHSLAQLDAAIEVLPRFLDELLHDPARRRHVQTVLLDLSYIVRDSHAGRFSHLHAGARPEMVLDAFLQDQRLDARWRQKILAPCRKRTGDWIAASDTRRTP